MLSLTKFYCMIQIIGNEKINNKFDISKFIYSQQCFNCFLLSLSSSVIKNVIEGCQQFEKVSLRKGILNLALYHDGHINKELKSISKNTNLTEQQYKKVKSVQRNPGILYGLFKVHKAIVDVCPVFCPMLSAIGTLT